MDQFEKQMIDIVNRNYQAKKILARIDKNMDIYLMAVRLRRISKGRRK